MKQSTSIFMCFILGAIFIGSFQSCSLFGPSSRRTIIQWEFMPAGLEDGDNFQCLGMLSGTKCLTSLRLVKRVNGRLEAQMNRCCWKCNGGRSWCLEVKNVWPGKIIRINNQASAERKWCDNSRASDFRGNGLNSLREYLDWLVREFGTSVGLDVGDVTLTISNEYPPPTVPGEPGKLLAGTVFCPSPSKYIIVIYEHSFTGKTVAEIYNTIAHEFKHILQIIEHGLDCEQRTPQLEEEADRWAEQIAPLSICN